MRCPHFCTYASTSSLTYIVNIVIMTLWLIFYHGEEFSRSISWNTNLKCVVTGAAVCCSFKAFSHLPCLVWLNQSAVHLHGAVGLGRSEQSNRSRAWTKTTIPRPFIFVCGEKMSRPCFGPNHQFLLNSYLTALVLYFFFKCESSVVFSRCFF